MSKPSTGVLLQLILHRPFNASCYGNGNKFFNEWNKTHNKAAKYIIWKLAGSELLVSANFATCTHYSCMTQSPHGENHKVIKDKPVVNMEVAQETSVYAFLRLQ